MNLFGIAIALIMLVRGMSGLFAAWRLSPHRADDGGTFTFPSRGTQGLVWVLVGAITMFGSTVGRIELELPPIIAAVVTIIFLADSLFFVMESLWFGGVVREKWFRRAPEKKLSDDDIGRIMSILLIFLLIFLIALRPS